MMKLRSFTRTAMLILLSGAALLAACGTDWSGALGDPANTLSADDYWTIQSGAVGASAHANGVAVDLAGNVYITGYTTGGLDGNTLTGTFDYFVTKYTPSRDRVYSIQRGVAGKETTTAGITADADGNVYVTGYTYGVLDGSTLSGNGGYFVTKYTATGSRAYTLQGDAAGGAGIAVDGAGTVYVIGNSFVTKFTSTGTLVSTIQIGVAGVQTVGRSIAVDPAGNVYATGSAYGGLDGNTLSGNSDYFVIKYTATGSRIYTKQAGTAGKSTHGNGVAVDASGNVYVTGYTYGGLDGNTLSGTCDYFVSKYDPAGNLVYTRQAGAPGEYAVSHGVAVDAAGDVYVAGYTTGSLDGNKRTGLYDYFLAKYTSAGSRAYTKQSGPPSGMGASQSVAVAPAGMVYMTGYTSGGLDGNRVTGAKDYFIVKYDSLGNKQ